MRANNVDVVDLNKVLDAVALVLAESDKKGEGETVAVNAATAEVSFPGNDAKGD